MFGLNKSMNYWLFRISYLTSFAKIVHVVMYI